MSKTPIFDEVAALHPNIDITVHEEAIGIYEYRRGNDLPVRVYTVDHLQFDYMEPLPELKPLPTRKPWQ